ncbi:hypothetical protein FISHEDRAFT_72992 [Fistulina hepatica ATCC 64428]|uniref:Uncharacterized protein n=1 Tax=Fistulina hepatica ATCC 64428 TaxID=1128425 RepID=A0A0D7AGU9_9AGAR|nr:hypothetical protein FISHEDRAFT_72992 [Fistulina hepatica ATCC 64428]
MEAFFAVWLDDPIFALTDLKGDSDDDDDDMSTLSISPSPLRKRHASEQADDTPRTPSQAKRLRIIQEAFDSELPPSSSQQSVSSASYSSVNTSPRLSSQLLSGDIRATLPSSSHGDDHPHAAGQMKRLVLPGKQAADVSMRQENREDFTPEEVEDMLMRLAVLPDQMRRWSEQLNRYERRKKASDRSLDCRDKQLNRVSAENLSLKGDNGELKANNAALREENAALKADLSKLQATVKAYVFRYP